ncbi:hypothetical protein D1007_18141 [Hordeum vulgare]|nr:hypothetical protein D1007_18141 [Hordeum vulgare]
MTAQEYANREQRQRDRCNVACRSKFEDSDVSSPHITADPDLAYTRALHRSVLTLETARCHLRCLDGRWRSTAKSGL